MIIKVLALTFGLIVTAYSFYGMSQMKAFHKGILIISLIAAWVFGIWAICEEESKTKDLEKKDRIVMHNDSLFIKHQDSIADITCKNTTTILLRKNDSLKSIIGYYQFQKGNGNVQVTHSGTGDVITNKEGIVVSKSPNSNITYNQDEQHLSNSDKNKMLNGIQSMYLDHHLDKKKDKVYVFHINSFNKIAYDDILRLLSVNGYSVITSNSLIFDNLMGINIRYFTNTDNPNLLYSKNQLNHVSIIVGQYSHE